MNIGKSLAEAREKRGVSQKELASRTGLSPTYLSQIENGKKEPLISTLRLLAEKLDVPLAVIFFLSLSEDDVPASKQEIFRMLSPSLHNIISHVFLESDDSKA